MERRDKATRRQSNSLAQKRFSGLAQASQRSPREEVIEILAEGMWTLICQGRGTADGKFRPQQDDGDGMHNKDCHNARSESEND